MELYSLFRVGLVKASTSRSHPAARRRLAVLVGALCLSLAFLNPAWAGDGALDLSFNPGSGVSAIPIIRGQAPYNDGKSLMWGDFTAINGYPRNGIVRFNANGTVDTGFNAPVGFSVTQAVLVNPADPLSKILICGDISSGGNWYKIARLDASGAIDPTFANLLSEEEGGGGVKSIAVQADGKILVGGFSLVIPGDTTHAYHLLRLNADGTLDPDYPKRSSPGGYVNSVKALPSNHSLAPNGWRIIGTLPRPADPSHVDYFLIFNSSGAQVFNVGDEIANGPVLNVEADANGKLVLAGAFTQILGAPRNRIARLQSGGAALDDTFQIGTGANAFVANLTIQSDGKLMLAGKFTDFNGTPCGYMVRLNSSGTVDDTFNAGTGADDDIFGMHQDSPTQWSIRGAFRHVNGFSRQCFALLDANGAVTSGWAGFTSANTSGFGGVMATAVQPDGKILIGGDFTAYRGKYHAGLARLNPDGSEDASFRAGGDGMVRAIALQPDGKILLAGSFGAFNRYARTGVARLSPDGSLDKTFNPLVVKQNGAVGDIRNIKPLTQGQIMIAGGFDAVNGADHSICARLNSNGSLDGTFNALINIPTGTKKAAWRVAEVSGKYLVSGSLDYGSPPSYAGFLTRLTITGAVDSTFGPTGQSTPAPHVNIFGGGEVRDMALTSDGRIVVCGDFTQIIDGSSSQPSRSHIARFTASGLLDNTFIPISTNNWSIQALALQSSGKVLIGGDFSVPYAGVARLNANGTLDASFNPGTGAAGDYNPPMSITRLPGGKAVLGGWFNTYNGVSRPGLARIYAGEGLSPGSLLLLLGD